MKNAGRKNALIDVSPRTVARVMPNDAPDEMPNVYGSARGFLKMLCKAQPLLESPAPTIIAARIRGARSFQIIVLNTFVSDGKNNARNRFLISVVVEPKINATNTSAISNIKKERNIGLNGLFIIFIC